MNVQTSPQAALDVKPRTLDPDTGIEKKDEIAGALSDVLADTYLLMIKTHAHHWNVAGPLFYSVHKLTEEQYEDMFDAVDVMAERVRALGALAPSSVQEMLRRTEISESSSDLTAAQMVNELADDHETVARRLHRVANAADEANDIVTDDLAVARSAFHEKAAWMLRALVTG